VPGDVDQDRDGPGQCQLRCSDSSVDIDKYRRFAPCRYRGPSGRARFPANRKSAVRKRGPIERFVENQRPGIEPCGLVRVPAGSCGKIRTPAGSRWGGTLRQTYVTQRLRTAANSCGKVRNPAPTADNPTSSAPAGSPTERIRQDASSIPIGGMEPASASTHPTFVQAVTNRSRNARRPWS
jgi:hypothetical protein